MTAFLFIGLLIIVFTSFYFLYHFILKFKQPERKVPKKLILSLLVGGIISFSIGAAFLDTSDQARLNEEIEANEVLTAEISDLRSTTSELQLSYEMLEKDNLELLDLNDELTDENETLTDEVKTLTKNNESLEEEIDSLTNSVIKLESKISKQETASKNVSKKSGNTKSASTNSNNSGEKPSKKSSTSSSSSTNNSSSSTEECDIKGSESGIYHVPGSTYYSRTTNVVQWFCSTSEAENAGYRAPKR